MFYDIQLVYLVKLLKFGYKVYKTFENLCTTLLTAFQFIFHDNSHHLVPCMV